MGTDLVDVLHSSSLVELRSNDKIAINLNATMDYYVCIEIDLLFFYYYRLLGSITGDDMQLVLVNTSFYDTEAFVIPSLERVNGR